MNHKVSSILGLLPPPADWELAAATQGPHGILGHVRD